MATFENLTYTRLVGQLQSYGERSDATYLAQIPVFVMLAENRLATEMKQQGFQAVVNGQFDLSNVQAKPSFWKESISFGYVTASGEFVQLYLRSLEWCRAYWPNSAEKTPAPMYYADYNINHFMLAGTPNARLNFELVYYARLDPLTEDHQENWMTLNAPQALLYAALLEAAVWKKNNADIARMTAQYQGAVSSLLRENQERLADRGTVVERG